MLIRKLGRTGLNVAALCLGGNTFGWTTDQKASEAVLDAYLEAGGNFIDTADVYARWAPGNKGGESETALGIWMAARRNRQAVVMATKVCGPMGPGPNDKGLSRQHIVEGVEASLKRLQTDYIDLYQAHWDDRETPLEETLRAFVRYFYEGKPAVWDVVSLGQWPADSPNAKAMTHALQASRRAHFAGVSSVVPFVPIAGDWETFWQSRSYLFRKSRRGILNRLKRLGEVEVIALGGDRAEEALRLYLDIAERGWKHTEGLSAVARPELKRFFEALTKAAGRRGWLRVWALRIGDATVAVEYHIEAAGRVHALRADYDESWSAHSPGACLEYHILHRLFEEGYREYSTGPGADDYKRRWTDQVRTNVSLTLCRATPRGMRVWLVEGVLLPALRRARRRVQPVDEKAA